MAVNSLNKEQVYTLLNQIAQEATGQTGLVATDYSSFVSVANATLAVGTEKALNAISNVLQRTIIAVRPYYAKFKGLEMTADQWGGIIRKISYADRGAEQEEAYLNAVTDGATVDPWKVRKPNVLETRYYNSDIFSAHYTIYETQLKEAFQNEASLGSFIAGLLTHFSNERETWLESLKRGIVVNAIAGKNALKQDVINLRTEYNAATGLDLTAQDIFKPANYKPFMEWAYARVAKISREFTARSQKYQQVITGKPIMRHTPYEDQRVYMSAEFLEGISAQVLADTYHENFLRYADVEAVDFWQAIDSPMSINATPVYIDATGAVTTGTAQVLDNVVGVIFDRDAMGYNIYNESLNSTSLNPSGLYYNLFAHADIQLQNDFTEKIAVITLN